MKHTSRKAGIALAGLALIVIAATAGNGPQWRCASQVTLNGSQKSRCPVLGNGTGTITVKDDKSVAAA